MRYIFAWSVRVDVRQYLDCEGDHVEPFNILNIKGDAHCIRDNQHVEQIAEVSKEKQTPSVTISANYIALLFICLYFHRHAQVVKIEFLTQL